MISVFGESDADWKLNFYGVYFFCKNVIISLIRKKPQKYSIRAEEEGWSKVQGQDLNKVLNKIQRAPRNRCSLHNFKPQ